MSICDDNPNSQLINANNFQSTADPVMTCYKLVTVHFKWFGIQGQVESFMQNTERRLFLNFHRQLFCWMDRWYDLTLENIRALEEETRRELEEVR